MDTLTIPIHNQTVIQWMPASMHGQRGSHVTIACVNTESLLNSATMLDLILLCTNAVLKFLPLLHPEEAWIHASNVNESFAKFCESELIFRCMESVLKMTFDCENSALGRTAKTHSCCTRFQLLENPTLKFFKTIA